MKKRILIIDDDRDYIDALRIVLEKAGYDVDEIYTAEKGLRKVETYRPDLIILDGMMEDLSAGFRFAKTIKSGDDEKRNIPVLMVSSIQQLTGLKFERRKNTELLPVDEFMEKPVENDELISKIKELIE